MQAMKVLIIPAWLKRKLDANRIPLNVLLDFKRLSNILTPEDLFFVLKLNIGDSILGDYKVILEDFPNEDLIQFTYDHFTGPEHDLLSVQFEQVEGELNRFNLILGDVLNQEEGSVINLHNYDTVMLAPEVAAVVVSPNNSTGYSNESLTAFLEVLKGQMGYDRITKLKVFEHFVKRI